MTKLGQHVRHPKYGIGQVLGYTKWPGREYVVRFRKPDGWITAYMSRAEVWHRPKRVRPPRSRPRKPVNADHQPATLEESRDTESYGLTLRQLRQARADL